MPELIYLRGSPWSLATLWAVRLAGVQLPKLTEHEAGPFGERALRSRLGLLKSPEEKVTVPVMIRDSGETPLRDSMDIVRWAAKEGLSKGIKSGVLPTGKDIEVQELVDLSNVVLRFMRNTLWDHGDSFPYKMLPWPVYIIPGLRDIVGWIAKRFFVTKYGEEDSRYTEDSVKASLAKLGGMLTTDAAAAAGGSLLQGCGSSLTVGDIFAAVAVESMAKSVEPGGVTVIALFPNTAASSSQLLDTHPRLLRWRDAVFAGLPEDVRHACSVENMLP